MGDITLRQALEEYKQIYMASRNFAQRTRVEYLNDLEDLIRFLERLGLKEVRNIGLPQLERYLAELDQRGLAGTTRKRKVVSIRSFLWYLYQDQYISTNLAKRLIPPFAEVTSPRYLTKLEYERLLETASNDPRDYAIVQLLLQTGIKLSELTRLTMNDVEFPSTILPEMTDVGYLNVLGSRSKKPRVIPLNSVACGALKKFLEGRTSIPSATLFINRFGMPLGSRGVEKVLNKYFVKAGILKANVQSLRHTFGIHQIAKGTEPKIVRKIMGNKDSQSTSIYVSLVYGTRSDGIQNHAL